jgi:hypothetical protein
MRRVLLSSCLLALFVLIAQSGRLAAAGGLPADCQAIVQADPAAGDGEYMIGAGGHVFRVYCYDMAGAPREYLPLIQTGSDQNYSMYRAGAYSPGTNVISRYARLRLDPQTLVVNTGDKTFATSEGELLHNGRPVVTSMAYAVAMNCGTMEPAYGNLDLRGTPFKVDDTFTVGGWDAYGLATFSEGAQVVALAGGGYCGHINPWPGADPVDGDGILNLGFVGYPNLVIDGCDTDTENLILPGGATLGDMIDECAVGAKNHGKFVSCVAQLTNAWRAGSLITAAQKGSIVSCAAQSSLP